MVNMAARVAGAKTRMLLASYEGYMWMGGGAATSLCGRGRAGYAAGLSVLRGLAVANCGERV